MAAAERPRRSRGVGILVGVKGVATPAARRRYARGLLNDGRGSGDLRLIASRRLLIDDGRRLYWRQRGRIRQGNTGLARKRSLRTRLGTALKHPQTLFQLPVTVLQLLVLPGELPQLVFELLDPGLRIDIVGLRERRGMPCEGAKNDHRSQRRGTGNFM